jgi:transcription antitermination protein NusB
MLSRRHIRIKVLQALYTYFSAQGEFKPKEVENQLQSNINDIYKLYLDLLLFVREFIVFVEKYDDEVKASYIHADEDMNINVRLYQNPLSLFLLNNEILTKVLEKEMIVWDQEYENVIRKVFLDLKSSEVYHEYIRIENNAIEQDFEIISYILKYYCQNFSMVEQFFEDKYINWYDDSKIAIQSAIKTFKNIIADPENDDFLINFTNDKSQSREFAIELFNHVIANDENHNKLILERIDKWEPSRVPLIDKIILKMGISELTAFKSIPVKVTINECIELAKNYSTPNSKKFINGVLDNLQTKMMVDGTINKSGLGLINE